MSKKIYFFLSMIIVLGFTCATSYEENYSVSLDSIGLQIEMLRYDSYPVVPGEYFNLYIKVQCQSTCKDAVFELSPTFPFSVDDNESLKKSVGTLTSATSPIVLEYKIRVAEDAVSGYNPLTFLYGTNKNVFVSRDFDIRVEDVKTSFDIIVQDYEDNDISIAIANTGKNDASSMIIRIPEQKGIVSSVTNSQMLGNLESGDYTVAAFTLTGNTNILTIQLDYTDAIGERRIEYLNLTIGNVDSIQENQSFIKQNSTFDKMPYETMPQMNRKSSAWKTILIVVGIIVIFVGIYLFYKRCQIKKKSQSKKVNLPNWIKNKGANVC